MRRPGGYVCRLSEVPADQEREIYKLGYDVMDTAIAFRTRAISVLTGVPGTGKTTFSLWLGHHLVRQNKIKVGFASFETTPQEIGVKLRQLSSSKSDSEFAAFSDEMFRFVVRTESDTVEHDLTWFGAMLAYMAEAGCKVVFMDPWNELEHVPEGRETMTQYVNHALTKLRQWAEDLGIHICLIAHPKKMERRANGDITVPTGYDVAESAAFFNKPDMGLTVHIAHDDTNGDHVRLKTWKVRDKEGTGTRNGEVRLRFDPESYLYQPINRVLFGED